ncbi:MAG TPA: protease inhibitor I42 family protein [Solirubrobacteraceae bacterium]|nr:protease inhibitor I42 family protein [Solirubrobacteraceae bacterium]
MTLGDDVPAELRAKVGETFALALPATATAGFGWVAFYDADRLALVGDEHEPAGSAPGAAGRERFEFRVLAPGETVVRLAYGRPWDDSPREERELRVVVEA